MPSPNRHIDSKINLIFRQRRRKRGAEASYDNSDFTRS